MLRDKAFKDGSTSLERFANVISERHMKLEAQRVGIKQKTPEGRKYRWKVAGEEEGERGRCVFCEERCWMKALFSDMSGEHERHMLPENGKLSQTENVGGFSTEGRLCTWEEKPWWREGPRARNVSTRAQHLRRVRGRWRGASPGAQNKSVHQLWSADVTQVFTSAPDTRTTVETKTGQVSTEEEMRNSLIWRLFALSSQMNTWWFQADNQENFFCQHRCFWLSCWFRLEGLSYQGGFLIFFLFLIIY